MPKKGKTMSAEHREKLREGRLRAIEERRQQSIQIEPREDTVVDDMPVVSQVVAEPQPVIDMNKVKEELMRELRKELGGQTPQQPVQMPDAANKHFLEGADAILRSKPSSPAEKVMLRAKQSGGERQPRLGSVYTECKHTDKFCNRCWTPEREARELYAVGLTTVVPPQIERPERSESMAADGTRYRGEVVNLAGMPSR